MDISGFYRPVESDLEKVDHKLQEIADVDTPHLAELLRYLVQDRGKHIRPALTLLAGKFHKYNLTKLIPMAAAIELLHNATLVHDDIVDNSPTRRGKPSICTAWGQNSALLLGDYLFARAGKLVASTENLRVIDLFAQTLMTISSGELAQIGVIFDKKKVLEHYYDWISAKTSCLFSTATESGAVLSEAPEVEINALKEYGHYFGMAFQIIDDILDFTGQEAELGKPVGSDLIEGAVTLPIILYVNSHQEIKIIKKAMENKDTKKIALIVKKVRNSPIIEECLSIATDFSHKACKALDKLPDCEARTSLLGLVNFIIQRRK